MKKVTKNQFQKMLLTGVNAVVKEADYINDLNVYPVPDGDTGINLKMTLSKAVEAVYAKEYASIALFVKAFAYETLINARGNSGVIMSQIIRGLTLSLKEFEENKLDIELKDFFQCFVDAQQIAYKSVVDPTEGTMLTVTRFINKRLIANKKEIDSIEKFFELVYLAAADAVIQSPNLLPVLKENNAIDSGAYALFKFFGGFLTALNLPFAEIDLFSQVSKNDHKNIVQNKKQNFNKEKISFGYCCEFVLKLNEKVAPNQKEKLPYNYANINSELKTFNAESVVIVQEEGILKIHAHLIEPYQFLKLGQKYGEFFTIKIDNMVRQFHEHVSDVIKRSESKEIIFDKSSIIFSYLPTTEINEFVKSNYGLDYFWDLEKKGDPTYRNIVSTITETKSKKIYGLISDKNQKQKFLSAQKFINKKQDLHLIPVQSTLDTLYKISLYKKKKPNWWNTKILSRYAKRHSIFEINESCDSSPNQSKISNSEKYSISEKQVFLESKTDLKVCIQTMFEKFLANNKKKIDENNYWLCFIYNDQKIAKYLKEIIAKNNQIKIFAFYVSDEKKLLSLGYIKCPQN